MNGLRAKVAGHFGQTTLKALKLLPHIVGFRSGLWLGQRLVVGDLYAFVAKGAPPLHILQPQLLLHFEHFFAAVAWLAIRVHMGRLATNWPELEPSQPHFVLLNAASDPVDGNVQRSHVWSPIPVTIAFLLDRTRCQVAVNRTLH